MNRKEINKQRRTQWANHIESWSGSGLSQVEYCRKNNLKSSRFTYWKKALAKINNKPTFIEVPTMKIPTRKAPAKSEPIKLMLDSGMYIEITDGFNQETLRSIIRTLRDL